MPDCTRGVEDRRPSARTDEPVTEVRGERADAASLQGPDARIDRGRQDLRGDLAVQVRAADPVTVACPGRGPAGPVGLSVLLPSTPVRGDGLLDVAARGRSL